MRDITDLSHVLTSDSGSFCEGHPRFARSLCCTIDEHGSAVSHLSLSSHTGTHIDAPAHFIPSGATVDSLSLSQLICPAVVIDARGHEPSTLLDWEEIFARYEGTYREGVAVLVCTGWSAHWSTKLYPSNPRLSPSIASRLLDAGVRVLGIDALSPDGESAKHEVHHVWLGRGGIIAENLNGLERLLGDGDGEIQWMVSLLPLRIERCDGSPVRAIAWRE
ncbi:putative cyclase [Vararia minispora EC-137]|uniref:Cyclase n=1 Tax=Vararia minispora EC-137 TaxID=1314806 RepID=A0ACB8QUW6_9AGAM|nr:putative cyclase [Vararia minispora EC-137]